MADELPQPLTDIAASLEAPSAAVQAPVPASGTVTRRVEHAWLGGVCAGLAERLGWPVGLLRAFFLATTFWLFSGIALYGVLWLLLPPERSEPAVGVAAASRTGLRTTPAPNRRLGVILGLILGLYGVGAAGLVNVLGHGWVNDNAFSIMGVLLGGALIWRQWDRGDRTEVGAGWAMAGKVVVGGLLALATVVVSLWLQLEWSTTRSILLIGTATLGLTLILAAPWLLHPEARANRREEELVEQTKADMAAHLHDSVLQTLAMIQRQSTDAKAVAHLARRQERELRTWLYGDADDAESLKAALQATTAEIEDTYSVPIDIVTVGDAELTPALDALVRAAREAILNAAKHSGASRIDVYAEVGPETVEVFVRDRGHGFDAAGVGEDRMGIRGSILDRMHRHGGIVGLRSTVGEGTEVRLEMRR
jgi:phage shock protein PspC (stress-responsive transcriptional regulator)/signal transduction histidine kinase